MDHRLLKKGVGETETKVTKIVVTQTIKVVSLVAQRIMKMLIKRTDNIVMLLNEATEEQWPRHYLGMSQVGDPCERKLQYYFRFAKKEIISAKLARIFRDGRVLELEIIKSLERTGLQVVDKQDETIGFAGHEKGHNDGVAINVPFKPADRRHLLEVKTHNKKNFDAVVKHGVRKAKPLHFDQMTKYMPSMKCEHYMYVAYCKDDSAIWVEFGEFDAERYAVLCEKAERIITSDRLQNRIGTGLRTWHECTYCSYKAICHDDAPIAKTCRSCDYISVEDNGVFRCAHPDKDQNRHYGNGNVLSLEEQYEGCTSYSLDLGYFGR